MNGKTYRTLHCSETTLLLLERLSLLADPTQTGELAKEAGIPLGTLMTHLATLEKTGFVQRVGLSHYEVTNKLAKLWATRKRILLEKSNTINKKIEEIE
jgi:DNA-binding IclR family transcriptional regulator